MTAPSLPAAASWTEHAACIGDWEPFYPQSATGRGHHRAESFLPALAICRTCPVGAKSACLAAALEHETTSTRHGVWGGTTPEQRDLISRRRS